MLRCFYFCPLEGVVASSFGILSCPDTAGLLSGLVLGGLQSYRLHLCQRPISAFHQFCLLNPVWDAGRIRFRRQDPGTAGYTLTRSLTQLPRTPTDRSPVAVPLTAGMRYSLVAYLRGPKDHMNKGILQFMVAGIPLVLGLGTSM